MVGLKLQFRRDQFLVLKHRVGLFVDLYLLDAASMQCRDFLQTASRYESREKCRDTSMHRRRIRIDTDFHRKNTDSSQEIVACLVFLRPGRQGLVLTWSREEAHRLTESSCFQLHSKYHIKSMFVITFCCFR